MSNELPWGIKNKVTVPDSARIGGTETFGNKGFYGPYFDQLLFELKCNHIWGTETQVKAAEPEATFYTDGSGDPFDLNDSSVTISDDQKILINHDVTQTAKLLLDAGGVKITIEMLEGVTLDMDTFDLTLGGSGDSVGGDIRITQTGNLVINGNRGLKVNNSVGVYEDFKTKNLIINVQSNTTVDVDADNIIFVDEFGGGTRINNINETFDMTTDRPDGDDEINELASTWYQKWLDKDLNKALVPDLTGTANSNVENELIDSGAAFETHLVQPGDIVFNLDDLTQGTVVSVETGIRIILNADIFPDGNESYKIRMLSPVGLGDSRARIGVAFNNSSGHFDDSTYTQIQEEKEYTGDGTDFTVTSNPSVVAVTRAKAFIRQINDWTGKGTWKINFNVIYSVANVARTIVTMTLSGVTNKSGAIQAIVASHNNSTVALNKFQASAGTGVYVIQHASVASTLYHWAADVELERKPDFHN